MCVYDVCIMYVVVKKLGIDDGSWEPAANEAKSVDSIVSQDS